mmetsp:Transcript_6000/g.8737  ORF Transcript_6000/g.8737 Transcript_6000/m.8737 type:complete len:834 (-) Transcript_6000:439-2940(-)
MAGRPKWNRKRKVEQSNEKKGRGRRNILNKDHGGSTHYRNAIQSNPRMEAYYAYQGLHNTRRKKDEETGLTNSFVPCETEEEKEEERTLLMESLRKILPASFRIGKDIDKSLREQLERQLEGYVGKEFEIMVNIEDGKGYNGDKDAKSTISSTTNTDVEVEDRVDESDNGVKIEEMDKEIETKIKSDEGIQIKPKENVEPQPKIESTCNTQFDEIPKNVKMIKKAPAKRIPFIPHAYQLSVDRRTLRRNPKLEHFHNWLKEQVDAGFITRQETVSMIPPVVLAPEPTHGILDMCAAPGSKTSQLLEIVGAVPEGALEPGGFVVANDSDAKRAYMLVHQLRRLNTPAAFITSVDGQFWPVLVKESAGSTPEECAQEGLFDRVLCDVPCSGDGTTRKNPGIWKHWSTSGGLSLHPLQISIALNGARLTKVGGYMCYSTCSLNPIENEAVVAEILRSTDGSLELVNGRINVPGLEARPGWTTWKVLAESQRKKDLKKWYKKNNPKMQARKKQWDEENLQKDAANSNNEMSNGENKDKNHKESPIMMNIDNCSDAADNDSNRISVKDLEGCDQWSSAPSSWDEEALRDRAKAVGLYVYDKFDSVPEESRRRIRESCFPSHPPLSELTKCMRCLPHDMDTGGFFIALFKKIKPMSQRARAKADALANDLNPHGGCKRMTKDDSGDSIYNSNSILKKSNAASAAVIKESDKKANGNDIKDSKEDKSLSNLNNTKKSPDKSKSQKKKVDLSSEKFVPVAEHILKPIVDFYGLTDMFPLDQIMSRASGEAKILYFISSGVKKNLIDRNVQDRVTVINSGLRAFERGNRDSAVLYVFYITYV